MNEDLAALLVDPTKVADVPTEDVPALLDALARDEGRCRVVRDLLTRRLVSLEAAPAPILRDWLTVAEVASMFGCADRTVRRRMHDGTWREGEHWFSPNGTEPRFSRPALEAWQRTGPTTPSPDATPGLAFGPDLPQGRRRRSRLQNVA